MQPFPSFAFASKQVASPLSKLYSVTFSIDPALATGTYYLLILNNGALATPGTEPTNATDLSGKGTNGAKLALFSAPVVHTNGVCEQISISAADFGYPTSTGWSVADRGGFMFCISSTAPTSYTSAGAHVWTNATGE